MNGFTCIFGYWLSRRTSNDERQINRWKEIVSRFEVKMIKDASGKIDDYSVSPKIRQVLLH